MRCGAEAAVGGGARPATAPARAAPAPPPPSRARAAKAAAVHPAPPALFHFSPRGEYKFSEVDLSPDRLTGTSTTRDCEAWARSERGVAAGCGVVRWALQLDKDWDCYRVGVCSDFFSGYTESWPVLSWFFEGESGGSGCMVADGEMQGDNVFKPGPFCSGDVVTLELERAPGVDGVLRVRVAGKTPRELKGLPRDGMLYPIVCMCFRAQTYTMVPLP